MSDIDSPAGTPGGPLAVPALDDLPEKLRVHALARLLGRTSKEVLAALAELGVETRSAQSSVTRKDAEQVVTALLPAASAAPADGAAAVPGGPADGAAAVAEPSSVAEPRSADEPRSVDKPRSAAEPFGSAEPFAAAEPHPAVAVAAKAEGADETAAPAAVLAPLFAPPAPLFQPPAPATRSRRKAAAEVVEPVEEPEAATEDAVEPDTEDGDDGEGGGRRRRRRGRRGRGRGRGADEITDGEDGEDTASDTPDAGEDTEETESGEYAADGESTNADGESTDEADDSDDSDDSDDADDADESAGSRRRRRRRRRRGSGDDGDGGTDSAGDPPNTVTRVRIPRDRGEDREDDGVQSVRGSTRLEAKRQRRRDGRDAGRRRVPILSEAEFLARRESVDRAMVVRERGERIEIAVLEDDVLVEHYVTGGGDAATNNTGKSIVGNIYLGRVQNVLPSMEAAFVDIGRGRNAVLYAGEVDWDAAGLGGKARRIEQALSSGDSVLVQVTKDPIGHKGARLTTQISLAGRFLVYVPSGGAAGISRKLPDVERKRLKDMLKEIVPSEAGVIIRTASEGVSHQALERDVRRLQAQWEVVKEKAEKTGPNRPKAPALLYEEPDLLMKVVRDQFNEDFSRLVVAGDDAWDTVSNYVGHVAQELAERLHRHVGPTDVFADYRIDEQLLKALDRKVWLPSGGTLVIDRTEAMTVIDVNTGKFTGSGGNLEETVTRNNLEAAEEVVRQLRLRDIGGIIVIDFIDMVLEANRDLVLRRLTECLARDRTRHQVAEVTSLGLVQMTRKRVGSGLLEHFSTVCEHCRGRGVIVDAEPVAERVETGRGPDREVRRSRGGRGRRGSDLPSGEGGRNGQSTEPPGSGHAGNGTSARVEPVTVEPAPAPVVSTAPVPDEAPAQVPAVMAGPVAEAVTAGPVAEAVTAGPVAEAVTAAVETVPETAPDTDEAQVEVEVAAARVSEAAVPAAPVADAPADDAPAPRPRRRAVRRTAGAPSVPGGEAVTVVTVASPAGPGESGPAEAVAAAPVGVATQPEPTATSRPRRTRRAASRPAGPPVGDPEPGGDPV